MLQYHFNWKTLSAMAGVTWWNFYFRLFPGTIRSPQVIEFLEHLLRHLPGKLLVVWDGLTGHRSRMTWEFIRQQRGRLWVEFLPGYAPELNPVEYLWSHWKQQELPNFCPQNFGQLSHYARKALRRMRKRPTLVINLLAAGGTVSAVPNYAMLNRADYRKKSSWPDTPIFWPGRVGSQAKTVTSSSIGSPRTGLVPCVSKIHSRTWPMKTIYHRS